MKKIITAAVLCLLFSLQWAAPAVMAQARTELNSEALHALKQALGMAETVNTPPTVTTRSDLVAYLRESALSCREGVSFYYSDALASGIADRDWMSAVVKEGGVFDAAWSYNEVKRSLNFTRLVYFPEYYEYKEQGTALPPAFETLAAIAEFIRASSSQATDAAVFYYGEALDLYGDSDALAALIYSAGVKSFNWSFDQFAHRVELTEITYYPEFFESKEMGTALPPSFDTMVAIADFIRASSRQAPDSVVFYYGDTLDLYGDSDALAALIYSAGVINFDWSFSQYARRVELTEITYYPEFYESKEMGTALPPTFDTMDAIADFIWASSSQVPVSVVFYYGDTLDLYQDKDALASIIYSAGVINFDWSFSQSARRVELTGITYDPNPFRIHTMEDARTALIVCRSRQYREATFLFTRDLYQTLSADDFRQLKTMENQTAISRRSLAFSDSSAKVIYSNIIYASLYFHCSTLQDVISAMESCSDALSDSLTLFTSEGLFTALLSNNGALLSSIDTDSGLGGRVRVSNEAGLWIEYTNISYYPGLRILSAVRSGNTDRLTARERELLYNAQQIAAQAMAQSTTYLELEMALYDFVCANVMYKNIPSSGVPDQGSWLSDNDTAIGALLDGAADCDGYADAFYLLGNLAGLEVRYKHGDTNPAFADSTEDAGHMWNLIRLNEKWYMADVTWGDQEDSMPGEFEYCWLNIGVDRAAISHSWNPDACAVPLEQHTDPALFYYTRNGLQFFNLAEAGKYINSRVKAGQGIVQVMLSGGCYTGEETFNQSLRKAVTGSGSYTFTAREVGEDCFVQVMWEKCK